MTLLILTAAAAVALMPTAVAHDCAASYCGPCVEGEAHAHSDSTGSCVSYEERPSYGGGASVGAGRDGARADAHVVPGQGGLGALAALGLAALAFARR